MRFTHLLYHWFFWNSIFLLNSFSEQVVHVEKYANRKIKGPTEGPIYLLFTKLVRSFGIHACMSKSEVGRSSHRHHHVLPSLLGNRRCCCLYNSLLLEHTRRNRGNSNENVQTKHNNCRQQLKLGTFATIYTKKVNSLSFLSWFSLSCLYSTKKREKLSLK